MPGTNEVKKENIRILIIEDEDDQRLHLRNVLENEGYKIDETDTGEKAVKLIMKNHYAIIVTDLRLPGSNDGMEILRLAKRTSDCTDVILITAYGVVDTAVQAMINGAFDFIQKPVNMLELRVKIKRAVLNQHILCQLNAKEGLENDIKELNKKIRTFKGKLNKIKKECRKTLTKISRKNPVYTVLKRIETFSNT